MLKKKPKVHVFEVQSFDDDFKCWVAAENSGDAIYAALETEYYDVKGMGLTIKARALTAEELKTHTFHDEDTGRKRQFASELRRMVKAGEVPKFFAASEW